VATEGFNNPNTSTGGYTWKGVLKQLGQKELTIVPMDLSNTFYDRLGATRNRAKPDDRGILFDLGATMGSASGERGENPRGKKGKSKKRPKDRPKRKADADSESIAMIMETLLESDDSLTDADINAIMESLGL
jgi:hypothetical protein